MSRRRLKIAAHWAVVLLILMMVEGGTATPAIRWTFCAIVGLWLALVSGGGVLGRSGSKLTGLARDLYRPMHIGLYGLLGLSALLNAAELLRLMPPGPAWTSLLVLLGAGIFHAIFQLWRHTTLYDGALRLIAPKFIHKHL